MRKFQIRFWIFTLFAVWTIQTTIAAPQVKDTTPVDELSSSQREGEQKLVADITRAFAKIKTAEGRFTQIAENQLPSTGTFAIRRPRRMRFEYDAPSPLLIVADGTTIAVADRDLETVDRFPMRSSILRFLLQDEPDFEKKARIIDIEQSERFIALTLADKSEQADGQLSLLFSNPSYDLLGWRVVDSIGTITEVYLQDTKKNHKLNPKLFRLDDFDRDRDRRR